MNRYLLWGAVAVGAVAVGAYFLFFRKSAANSPSSLSKSAAPSTAAGARTLSIGAGGLAAPEMQFVGGSAAPTESETPVGGGSWNPAPAGAESAPVGGGSWNPSSGLTLVDARSYSVTPDLATVAAISGAPAQSTGRGSAAAGPGTSYESMVLQNDTAAAPLSRGVIPEPIPLPTFTLRRSSR